MRNRTPVGMMVDRACGIPDDYVPPARVTLECNVCGKTKNAAIDPTDPPGTAKIRMACPECAKGDSSMIDYYDKDGKQLLVPSDISGSDGS